MKFARGVFLLLWVCCGVWFVNAQEDPNCVGAPLPRLIVGEEGRVAPGEANNLRDAAGLAGTKNGKIPAGGRFAVLAGPVCADGLNWWQVSYEGVTGWTVEGQGTDYWVEPIVPLATPAATTTPPPPTNTPLPTNTPVPALAFTPPLETINRLVVGARARVMNDDGSSTPLILRSAPGLYSEALSRIEVGTLLTLLAGPIDADSYLWWQIETDDGQTGWVVEGARMQRTLLPLCPLTENRVAFVVDSYLYTADENGANRCIFELVSGTGGYNTSLTLTSRPNDLRWSQDGEWLMFVSGELHQMSANGSQRIRITDKSNLVWLNWSPDGERIVTVDMRDRFTQVWTQRADGSLLALLTKEGEEKIWAEWLADSETVMYVERFGRSSSSAPATAYVFYTVNILTGGFKEVFRTDLSISRPVLSPDRTRVVVSGSDRASGIAVDPHTYVLDARTGEILLDLPHEFSGLWSPDGTRLVSIDAETLTTLALVPESEPIAIPLSMPIPLADSLGTTRLDWLADGRLRAIVNGVFYHVDTQTGQVELAGGLG